MRKDTKKIKRSTNRYLAGVCAGLAEYLNFPVWVIRITFLILALIPHLTFLMIAIYLMLIVTIPASENNSFFSLSSLFKQESNSKRKRKRTRRVIKDVHEKDIH
ncbi:PspC domain-containing protein [Liquorilactobacillus oeni]|uniref:PspC domain-containing protein n=1 Tax=Liquorilactobacillus oeni TaxID=303241 RepID=UPI00070B344E|nr:PspC domain-containing protein [Liquorilactobacillus oeni]